MQLQQMVHELNVEGHVKYHSGQTHRVDNVWHVGMIVPGQTLQIFYLFQLFTKYAGTFLSSKLYISPRKLWAGA